jgi:hypothetical protein
MKKTPRLKGLIVLLMLTGSSLATSAAQKVECPAEIPAPSIQVVNMPGWKAFIQFPLHLSSAGMSAGPPESLAVLRGEPLNKKGQPEMTRFEFGEMGFDQGKWLDCGYGAGAQITLSKRLDDSLKECTVTYLQPERPDRTIVKIGCK